jgi:hypothetical protein
MGAARPCRRFAIRWLPHLRSDRTARRYRGASGDAMVSDRLGHRADAHRRGGLLARLPGWRGREYHYGGLHAADLVPGGDGRGGRAADGVIDRGSGGVAAGLQAGTASDAPASRSSGVAGDAAALADFGSVAAGAAQSRIRSVVGAESVPTVVDGGAGGGAFVRRLLRQSLFRRAARRADDRTIRRAGLGDGADAGFEPAWRGQSRLAVRRCCRGCW